MTGRLTVGRSCVRIMPRPWRAKDELQGALERGDLGFAAAFVQEIASEGRPVEVSLALDFLAVIARDDPQR
jgi:hypothetical protein